MCSIRIFKFILSILLLIICVNCNSSHRRSFDQLELALVSWYYKYHPTIASSHGLSDYNNQLEKFDFNSREEYKADINRFMIELSQIDETKLNDDQFIKYVTINNFLFNRYSYILNLNESSYSPKYYLEILYNCQCFT